MAVTGKLLLFVSVMWANKSVRATKKPEFARTNMRKASLFRLGESLGRVKMF